MATKAQNLKYRYGITVEYWQAMYDKQGGRCATCQRKIAPSKAQVDHNHNCPNGCSGARSCGQCVRGLLCHDCNKVVLGQVLQESAKGVEHAVKQLERFIQYLEWGIPEIEVDLNDSHAVTS